MVEYLLKQDGFDASLNGVSRCKCMHIMCTCELHKYRDNGYQVQLIFLCKVHAALLLSAFWVEAILVKSDILNS